ncbi:MAG: endonuclease/exonuclease/phosphatase family protein [Bacteroidales bacterium]|nr:endonuclease/exonuclease/phosphatase family protein [Bacteroidales bacterium]
MRTLLKWILILLNLAVALSLLLSAMAQYIDPGDYWLPAFLGLGFPVLFIINLVFVLIWLVQWKKHIMISLLVLILSFSSIQATFSLLNRSTQNKGTRKTSIISYNVRLFDVFNWSGRENNGSELLKFLGESQTDIICLQEFMVNNSKAYNLKSIKASLPDNPYNHIEYNYQSYKRKHGLAIFSKYPVISGGKGTFPGTRNMYMYADIELPDGRVRVFNNHLESIHLDKKQYLLIDSLNLSDTQTHRDEYRRILSSIRQAFRKRAEQARIVKAEINNSPYPVIVCGDFNSTPVSYTYHKIKKGLSDSFVKSGKGYGASYKELRFPLRIDYILYDPQLSSGNHKVLDVNFSDHKPVRTEIWFNP